MDLYLNPTICQKCGGACCKRYPGAAFPDDITRNYGKDMLAALVSAFRDGYTIDCREGELGDGYPRTSGYREDDDYEEYYEADDGYHQGLYVRPRCSEDNNSCLYNYHTYNGQCLFLTDTGCKLAPELRPTGCRMLEPKIGKGKCEVHGGDKLNSARAWWDHYEVITQAAKLVERELLELV